MRTFELDEDTHFVSAKIQPDSSERTDVPVGQELVPVGAHGTNPSVDGKHCCRTGSGSQVHFSSHLPIISWLCDLGKLPWVCELVSYFRV